MRGRPKKPTELKKLQGTEDKRWMFDNEVEFELATENNQTDLELSKSALKIFHQVCEQLRKTGIMAEVDTDLVAAYAQKMSTYKRAVQILNRQTEVIVSEKGERINPWFDVAERSLKQATQIGQLFGITPSARSRIPAAAAPKSKLEILKKKIS